MIDIQDIRLIDIETTSYCNLHCPQCDRFDRDGFQNKHMDLRHLDFDRVKKNLDIGKLTGLQEVRLEGDHGDPAMHPDIENIITFFQHVGCIKLVTNGSLRNPAWWRSLARFKNLEITFSIDGLGDTLHLYRIHADFGKIMSNAQAFIQSGGNAVWKFIVFAHNQHQVQEALELSVQCGFAKFQTQISNRNFYDQTDFPVYLDGVYQGRNLKMAESTRPRQDTKTVMLQKVKNETFRPVTCEWARQKQIYIDYLGNLIPCCMTSGLMWRKDISGQLWQKLVGDLDSINLYHHGLSSILGSKFYQQRLPASLQSIKTVQHVCVGNCS